MAKLELVFNCLHMFVAAANNESGQEGTVHVLMPATTAHGPGHEHVVKIFHKSWQGTEQEQGRSMRGWALELGNTPGRADTRLLPLQAPHNETIPNLTSITGGQTVSPNLVANAHHPLVAARVTLHGGRVTHLSADSVYEINRTEYVLASQVTWEMLGIPHELRWFALDPEDPNTVPLQSLHELPTEPDLGYRLEIHHVTPRSIPPGRGGLLDPKELADHYAMFYPLIGVSNPGPHLLPVQKSVPSHGVNCGTGSAKLGA